MREKAEQGIYPSRPPFGYRNNKTERTIEVDPEKAPVAKRIFELYGGGERSLSALKRAIFAETGVVIPKSYLHKILKNPFCVGLFSWDGKTYRGTHPPLISAELFERVQDTLGGRSKPKHRRYEFAFSGLLKCAYDHCTVTAELKKGRYVYYHCTGHRGKCALPYFREEQISERLGQVLKDIHIPDEVVGSLQEAFVRDRSRVDAERGRQQEQLEQRLVAVRRRIDQSYLDKLDGKILEDFWLRKTLSWQEEEQRVQIALQALKEAEPDRVLKGARILELANKAYFLYLRQSHAGRAKLIRIVLSNCAVDAVNIYPTYRRPFDLILGAAKTGEWYARGDSNTRPLAS
jgi:hypothetical protein